ncbi:MAG: hypothetical protein ACRDSP_02965 [Pseudonocardiaceae bacterium]
MSRLTADPAAWQEIELSDQGADGADALVQRRFPHYQLYLVTVRYHVVKVRLMIRATVTE